MRNINEEFEQFNKKYSLISIRQNIAADKFNLYWLRRGDCEFGIDDMNTWIQSQQNRLKFKTDSQLY